MLLIFHVFPRLPPQVSELQQQAKYNADLSVLWDEDIFNLLLVRF